MPARHAKFFKFPFRLIRLIGVIVPRRLRADWRQEWEAELRYREEMLAEWDKLNWKTKLDLLRRSVGAFWDALWLQPQRLEDEMFQDLRYGVRMLFKNPAFTTVAIITLALGIGANTAIFSVVQAVLLRPPPFAEPDRVVMVKGASSLLDLGPDSPGGFLSWKEQNQVFEHVAAYSQGSVNLSEGGEPERILTMPVTASFFPAVGKYPALGRAFSAEEEQAGKNRVAVLSDGLWKRRFGADPQLPGQSLTLNGYRFTVIGIMPADFQFPQFPAKTELWIPLTYGDSVLSSEAMDFFEVIGRIKPDFTLAQAQAQMDIVFHRLQHVSAKSQDRDRIQLAPIIDLFVRDLRPALLILLGAVAFLLLIACANVANLLLARAAHRQKEIAIRSALGATRWRLARQWLTESLLLALMGGGVGLLMAVSSTKALVAISPAYIPRAGEIRIDGWVLGFALAVSLLTGVLFALAPAVRFSRQDLSQGLKENANSSASGKPFSRRLLVVAEVALSLVLLVGAGLLIQSFVRLRETKPGFNPANVLTLNLWLPRATYAQPQRRATFYQQLIERVEAVPDVQSVGAVNTLPLSQAARFFIHFTVEGRGSEHESSGGYRVVSPEYFQAMEIPLLQGRDFTIQDNAQAPRVVLINEALARRDFSDGDPIGKRLKIGSLPGPHEIVGVVGSVSQSLDQPAEPEFYLPHAQRPLAYMSIVVRTAGDPRRPISAVRQAVWEMDKEQPVNNIRTIEQVLGDSLSQRRFPTILLGVFAGVALVLAAVGIYGVVSYTVTQRTHEIGIRMALGAQAGNVLKLMVSQGMVPVVIGVCAGLPAAFALTRVLSSLLFGMSATDPVTFGGVALLLTVVALFACYIPARRATKVDPMVALRHG
ncbi:MAG: ABC transporter permease [Acidobacteriota bacterium]